MLQDFWFEEDIFYLSKITGISVEVESAKGDRIWRAPLNTFAVEFLTDYFFVELPEVPQCCACKNIWLAWLGA